MELKLSEIASIKVKETILSFDDDGDDKNNALISITFFDNNGKQQDIFIAAFSNRPTPVDIEVIHDTRTLEETYKDIVKCVKASKMWQKSVSDSKGSINGYPSLPAVMDAIENIYGADKMNIFLELFFWKDIRKDCL